MRMVREYCLSVLNVCSLLWLESIPRCIEEREGGRGGLEVGGPGASAAATAVCLPLRCEHCLQPGDSAAHAYARNWAAKNEFLLECISRKKRRGTSISLLRSFSICALAGGANAEAVPADAAATAAAMTESRTMVMGRACGVDTEEVL
jgi:hypothetical protein